jgi:hypothetical protein
MFGRNVERVVRAVADDRLTIGRFRYPVAAHLLRDAERVAVNRVLSGTTPDSWRDRATPTRCQNITNQADCRWRYEQRNAPHI